MPILALLPMLCICENPEWNRLLFERCLSSLWSVKHVWISFSLLFKEVAGSRNIKQISRLNLEIWSLIRVLSVIQKGGNVAIFVQITVILDVLVSVKEDLPVISQLLHVPDISNISVNKLFTSFTYCMYIGIFCIKPFPEMLVWWLWGLTEAHNLKNPIFEFFTST